MSVPSLCCSIHRRRLRHSTSVQLLPSFVRFFCHTSGDFFSFSFLQANITCRYTTGYFILCSHKINKMQSQLLITEKEKNELLCVSTIWKGGWGYHTLKSRANEREKKKMIIIKKMHIIIIIIIIIIIKKGLFFLPYILIASSSSTRMCGICAGNLRPSVRIPARWGRHIKTKKCCILSLFFGLYWLLFGLSKNVASTNQSLSSSILLV